MALTLDQYNQHVYNIVLSMFPTVVSLGEIPDDLRPALIYLLRRIIQYRRLGVDQDEAAKRLADEILTSLVGGVPTLAQRHLARNHWAEEALSGSSGEL